MHPPVSTLCKQTVIVPLAVVPPATKGDPPQVLCAPFVVPFGEWTIVWNLVTLNDPVDEDSPLPLQAAFAEDRGIQLLTSQPLNFKRSYPISPTQWAATLDNDIEQRVDALSYDVQFTYDDVNRIYSTTDPKVRHHDPTIVVSKDPIEPPPSGGRS